jgi:hypothetical protein
LLGALGDRERSYGEEGCKGKQTHSGPSVEWIDLSVTGRRIGEARSFAKGSTW